MGGRKFEKGPSFHVGTALPLRNFDDDTKFALGAEDAGLWYGFKASGIILYLLHVRFCWQKPSKGKRIGFGHGEEVKEGLPRIRQCRIDIDQVPNPLWHCCRNPRDDHSVITMTDQDDILERIVDDEGAHLPDMPCRSCGVFAFKSRCKGPVALCGECCNGPVPACPATLAARRVFWSSCELIPRIR